MELKLVKVKASFNWAIEANVNGEKRYRGFRYKNDALEDLSTWTSYTTKGDGFFMRDFHHNFDTAETLNIKSILS